MSPDHLSGLELDCLDKRNMQVTSYGPDTLTRTPAGSSQRFEADRRRIMVI